MLSKSSLMTPPKYALRFLRWFCREEHLEEIEGNLMEIFEKESADDPAAARRRFAWRVIKHFRPDFIRSFRSAIPLIPFYMLQHIILIAFRNFSRHKRIFAINLIGLTAGLTSVLLIYMWVQDELLTDQFHESKERLYRLKRRSEGPNNTVEVHESNSLLLPGVLETELPEVEYAIPTRGVSEATVAVGVDRIKVTGMYAGKDFFKAFSFPIIHGDRNSALSAKYNMAISEELAIKLFGTTEGCIGKAINWDLQHYGGDFVISAVFQKSRHSSEKFDFLMTHEMYLEKNRMDVGWQSNPIAVSITLKEGTDVAAFLEKLNHIYAMKRADEKDRRKDEMFMQLYSEMYLHGAFEDGGHGTHRIAYVRLFSGVAIFILAIACINFMNLSTARAQSRMKEIGVKKGLGVQRFALVMQHIGESMLLSLFALMLSFGIVIILLPQFNLIAGKQLTLFADWNLIGAAFVIALLTGLIAGSYPAFYLSAFKPAEILKGRFASSKHELFIRKGLVVFQFGISMVLIIGVAVVYRQLEFIQERDLGYNNENVILFDKSGELNTKLETFLDRARQISGVFTASSTGASITNNTSLSWGHNWEGEPEGHEDIQFSGAAINFELIEALGLEMKAGRSFSKELGDNEMKVIINETARRQMGIEDPVGKWFNLFGTKREIIGVVEDYQFQSAYWPMRPQFMMPGSERTHTIVLRISDLAVVDSIEKLFKEFNPGMPFEFRFLDDDYQALYLSEQRVSKLAQYFACIAIVLSCLGLFGLAAFSAERRSKELSIRKVMGCSEWRITRMLTFEFILMVIAAAIIALPLSWYYSEKWLSEFAYRSDLPLWLFAGATLLTLTIAIITVGTQALKAARVNPAQVLKTD